ncbi:hypothetical protein HW932_01745 [Allochromatium humboldtianum]|uniref:Uncharacterized protein n=1 Tax=Allochromatium humboldtianum TaxID=504901 RepID=A0A850R9M9_9GAMM|nr:hypothetical protein [Allochromatium humboldtianum]NVZ07982.1 hypothetical protein [Allochromatium humboldtianum]
MTMFVKIVRVPGSVSEIALNDGATVADALAAADITPSSNEELTVNGHASAQDATLSDGARIVLAKAAKSAA